MNSRIRWKLLDGMFRGEHPVTTEDIYKVWKKNNITPKIGSDDCPLAEQYGLTLRQDIMKFKKTYKDAGLKGDLIIISTDSFDGRKKKYSYSDREFSILPLLETNISRSEWAHLDREFKKFKEELPDVFTDQIDFLIRGRLCALSGQERVVDWSDSLMFKGYNMLPMIFKLISQHRPFYLQFKMFEEDPKKFVLHPYLLKEYSGRWYCLGYRDDVKELWPICLDRIEPGSIHPSDDIFIKFQQIKPGLSVYSYFENIIGVTKEYNEKTTKDYFVSEKEHEIRLGIHHPQKWMFLATNPIHKSQTTIKDFDHDKNYGEISIKVITNIELYNAILAEGPGIEVISPDFVRQNVIDMLRDMTNMYK